VEQPDFCRGDGAVQTWQLLPVDPPQSDLLDAYRSQRIVEFQVQVAGASDDPARLPHRAFILQEVAEGITLTLDYQGDPPPLVVGQSYRMIAWADLQNVSLRTSSSEGTATDLPTGLAYELRVFDEGGLLFWGLTDVDPQNDPIDLRLENAEGDCPQVPVLSNACIETRQTHPLRLVGSDSELILYPGEDGELLIDGSLYQVSLFRNRQTGYPEPLCPDTYEHQRSLRIERLMPPPVLPAPSETITATRLVTVTIPITPLTPITP
jgi:hypothetical protein